MDSIPLCIIVTQLVTAVVIQINQLGSAKLQLQLLHSPGQTVASVSPSAYSKALLPASEATLTTPATTIIKFSLSTGKKDDNKFVQLLTSDKQCRCNAQSSRSLQSCKGHMSCLYKIEPLITDLWRTLGPWPLIMSRGRIADINGCVDYSTYQSFGSGVL